MKRFSMLFLAVTAFLCLGVSSSSSDERPGALSLGTSPYTASCQPTSQYIELTPDGAGFKLMRTDTSNLGLPSEEPLAGTSAYVVAYVEQRRKSPDERPTISPNPQGVYLFRTTGGRFLIRIEDIPPDHGWYGPF